MFSSFGYQGDYIQNLSVSGNSFSAELARDYKDLALYERDEMVDWPDAELFSEKAIAAANNQQVMPENPADWNIETQQEMAELQAGRAELIQALDAGGRTRAPDIAALAQVKYDCWVEQQEEGWQTTHIRACKDDFYAALAALQQALQPTQVAVMTEAEQVVVYFEFDRSNITPRAAQALNEFARLLPPRQSVGLVIAGHTDTSGSASYNEALSARRAEAVQDYLADLGVTATELAEIEILALGETDLAVQTGDGVRLPENRRVVVQVNQDR
ncbi:OmpA family protein [Marinibaculum pumilum]|uniref:OmpA family protein n=1 Tax=Marinibaculum pumilum TaxID=1766165 RepID=A0ABV7LA02_9PROT